MPKLLYLVTEDWFFVSHFLPMARTAKAAGFEVVVVTRVRDHGRLIEAEGCRVVPLENERRSFDPFKALRSLAQMRRTISDEKPDVVHCISIRMVVLGGLAAKAAGVTRLVLAPTGLGHAWSHHGTKEVAARWLARLVAGRWLKGPDTRYLFENTGDPAEFGLDVSEVTVVPGAGVDPAAFPPSPEPQAPPLKVAVVARMIAPKGIGEAVAAVRRARALGADVQLDLYGTPDLSNRHTCTDEQLRAWSAEPGIMWRGRTNDVAAVWREHHVAMLLTWYREGVPRSLIEAAASGRPIVTTDSPGCRDLVRDGQEGFLVPPHDSEGAAHALLTLCNNPDLRRRLGAAAHMRFMERFTEAAITRSVGALYAGFHL